MKKDSKFQEAYRKLNPEQKEAVDTIEGPVMVIAGPGTGKTQILTLRIANIVQKTDTPPDAVLALTFTEAASFSMRKRLVEIMGPAAYRVNIFTFHSFANSIIQSYPDRFPNIIGASNINIIDQIKILQSIIDSTKLELLKPFGNTYYYVRPLLSLISKLKRENISVSEFKKRSAGEKNAPKYEEAYQVYKLYQEELRKKFLYDYDDMIIEVISALSKDKDLLLSLQEKYQYILADEHQDANRAQNILLELLASFYETPNLFIVGDEKQAIFRFQGASLDNFNYFKNKFSSAKIITLLSNYRSDQFILDAAASLIPEGRLRSQRKNSGSIDLSVYERTEEEMWGVREKIEELIEQGTSPGEIAVLYRDNKDAIPIIETLEKSKIPFVIESDQDILSDPDIKKLILLLRTVLSVGDQELFVRALHIDFLEIDGIDIYRHVRKEATSEKIVAFESLLRGWRKTSHNIDLVSFFEILVRESGFLKYILTQKESVEKMDKLGTLFDEIKSFVENHRHYGLRDFIEYVDLIEEHNILLKKDKIKGVLESVRLMTAHRSKGQEFDHVFVVSLVDGHWGNRSTKDVLRPEFLDWPGGDEDERRLFFVALTRARTGLHLSYSEQGREGKRFLPSRFIHEIDSRLILEERHRFSEKKALLVKKNSYQEKKRSGPHFLDKKYLKSLIGDREFSVTALNNYLVCPWRYFYSNLVRIPTAISKHQMYGIAIHAALKEFFDGFENETHTTKTDLLNSFERALRRQPLSEGDFERVFAKGRRALGGYFDTYPPMRGARSITEMSVKGVALGDVVLTGKLDRVDLLKDGARVIDYKTGKPKSRNEIVGISGNKTGDMKRQLVFYKLLLDNFERGKYNMVEGVIDFVEPNDRGYYKRESFVVTRGEVEELKDVIRKAVKEIHTLSFWNKRCSDKKCEYCALRNMMTISS